MWSLNASLKYIAFFHLTRVVQCSSKADVTFSTYASKKPSSMNVTNKDSDHMLDLNNTTNGTLGMTLGHNDSKAITTDEDRSLNETLFSKEVKPTIAEKVTQTLKEKTEQIKENFLKGIEKSINDDNTTEDSFSIKKRNVKFGKEWHRRKQQFLDQIALISQALLKSDHANVEDEAGDDEEITQQSDLTIPNRCICIVTTAALPWMTGTAVNPLLRAAYLWRKTNDLRKNFDNQTTDVDVSLNGTNDTVLEENVNEKQLITLLIPWLQLEEDRLELYGKDYMFQNMDEQETYIRQWMREKADLIDAADPIRGIKIIFYPARYHLGLRSIFAMGDMCGYIPDSDADVCILEEPEHLNWYRAPGEGWTTKFDYVIGIVHTNYKEYASGHYSGLWTSPAIGFLSAAMVRAYCHKVIKLSDVLQTYAPEKEVTSNVHGVRSEFLQEGKRRSQSFIAKSSNANDYEHERENEEKTYFIGKLLWAKGLDRMLDFESFYRQCTGQFFDVDIYGSGPDEKEIMRAFHGRKGFRIADDENEFSTHTKKDQVSNSETNSIVEESDNDLSDVSDVEDDDQDFFYQKWSQKFNVTKLSKSIKSKTESMDFEIPKSLHELRKKPIPARFPGRVDHSILKDEYKIFVNPSVSEVLCTTTAEALAMGKFVIIPVHPSNTFFMKFPNCLSYRNKMEFVASLRWALHHEPEPLSEKLLFEFTWEAATERLIKSAAITKFEARNRSKLGSSKVDERIAWFHNELGKGVKGDVLRKVLGAGPASDQVKFELEKKEEEQSEHADHDVTEDNDATDDNDVEDDNDEGLTSKFKTSSFARAIRSSLLRSLGNKQEI